MALCLSTIFYLQNAVLYGTAYDLMDVWIVLIHTWDVHLDHRVERKVILDSSSCPCWWPAEFSTPRLLIRCTHTLFRISWKSNGRLFQRKYRFINSERYTGRSDQRDGLIKLQNIPLLLPTSLWNICSSWPFSFNSCSDHPYKMREYHKAQ